MARGVARGDALQLLGLSRGASEREAKEAESTQRFQQLQAAYDLLTGKVDDLQHGASYAPTSWASRAPRTAKCPRAISIAKCANPGVFEELSTTELQNLLLEQDIFVLTGTKLDLCLALLQLFTLRELRRLQQAPRSKSRDDLLRQAEQQLRQQDLQDGFVGTAPGCLNTCGCSRVAPRRCANGLCRVCCLAQLAGLECRLHEDDDDFLLSDSEEEGADADRQGCAARCGALAATECENHRCSRCCAQLGAGRKACAVHRVEAFAACRNLACSSAADDGCSNRCCSRHCGLQPRRQSCSLHGVETAHAKTGAGPASQAPGCSAPGCGKKVAWPRVP
ncbi:unnamed protein product [Effrenium voratum]|nr:unnamed protein product [Effrenium voratum]